jgi:hypothetical protein
MGLFDACSQSDAEIAEVLQRCRIEVLSGWNLWEVWASEALTVHPEGAAGSVADWLEGSLLFHGVLAHVDNLEVVAGAEPPDSWEGYDAMRLLCPGEFLLKTGTSQPHKLWVRFVFRGAVGQTLSWPYRGACPREAELLVVRQYRLRTPPPIPDPPDDSWIPPALGGSGIGGISRYALGGAILLGAYAASRILR